MTRDDIETLGECVLILRRVKDDFARRAKHIEYKPIIDWLGSVNAGIESHARRLEDCYELMREGKTP